MSKLLRVLVVEDSEEDAELLIAVIRSGGYDPTYERVETAEAMSAALDRQSWDIAFSDYSMPHFNGVRALKLLREKGLDIPFIFLSGTIGEDLAVEAMKHGAMNSRGPGSDWRTRVESFTGMAAGPGPRAPATKARLSTSRYP